jgi:type VI secretion system protein VasD
MTTRRSLLLLPAALVVARCAPAPKPPAVLTLVVTGGAEQNPDPAGKPAPVAVRLYQLTATAKFERSDWTSLTEHEQATLGQDDAGSEEVVISPGQTLTKTIELKNGVQSLGVVVLYRDIDHAQWRAEAPVATSGPTKLALTVGKLAVTLKPMQG